MHPAVNELVDQLGKEYGLDINPSQLGVQRLDLGSKPDGKEELVEAFIKALKEAAPGDYLFVTHPDRDHPESRAMSHKGYSIARYADLYLLTNSEVKETIQELKILLIPYTGLKE